MLIVWFGIGISSKVFLAGTLVFFITFFNTLSGIRGVDKALCDVARVQGASEWQIFTKTDHAARFGLDPYRPEDEPAIRPGGRNHRRVPGIIARIGYRLNSYATQYNTAGAITMILMMMFLMMALTAVADRIDARLLRWRPSDREAGGVVPKA